MKEAIYQVNSRLGGPPVEISSWRYGRSLTELIVSDPIQFTMINSLPGRIRGATPGSHQDLGLIFIGRFSLLTIKKQEVYHFFCNRDSSSLSDNRESYLPVLCSGLSNSCLSFSLSLKHPKLFMAWKF